MTSEVTLDDFEGTFRTLDGHNLWALYTSEGASGSTSKETEAAKNDANGLRLNLTGGALYQHFFCNNGSEWAFAHELILSGTWENDTYHRMGVWVQHPAAQGTASPNGHTVELGTYVRSSGGDRTQQNAGGSHFYHFYNPRPSVWTYILMDWHPQHEVGVGEAGEQQYPTSSGAGWNYFDALTRFYYNIPYSNPSGYPAKYFWDDYKFFVDPNQANEDTLNISSLEASWNDSSNLLHLGFCRNQTGGDVTYTARYATSDLHALGFSNGTLLGTSGTDGQGANACKRIEGTVDLSGVSTVYIGVQKAGQSKFRQIALALAEAGGGSPPIAAYRNANQQVLQ